MTIRPPNTGDKLRASNMLNARLLHPLVRRRGAPLETVLEGSAERAVPMQDRDDENSLLLDKVHKPIGPDNQVTKPGQLRIGQAMTAVRELPKGLSSIDGELREASCIRVGVLRDERNGCFEIVDRGIGPDYWASHLERRFFTCSWLVTRPAAAACMLRSTFWRTYSWY